MFRVKMGQFPIHQMRDYIFAMTVVILMAYHNRQICRKKFI